MANGPTVSERSLFRVVPDVDTLFYLALCILGVGASLGMILR